MRSRSLLCLTFCCGSRHFCLLVAVRTRAPPDHVPGVAQSSEAADGSEWQRATVPAMDYGWHVRRNDVSRAYCLSCPSTLRATLRQRPELLRYTLQAVLDGVLHSFGSGATGFAFFSAADFDDGKRSQQGSEPAWFGLPHSVKH